MTENYPRSTSSHRPSPYQEPVTYKNGSAVDPTAKYQNPEDLEQNSPAQLDTKSVSSDSELEATPLVAEAIAQMLANLGISYAFGVAGGAMATIWGALSNSKIEVVHCRHEAGAAFAAVEAYFASNRPIVVFTTAGPGITNALTGLFAARGEGAKVILISACTSAPQRGRWAIQETSGYTLPSAGVFTSGALFNYATTLECAEQLPQISRRLALGLSQPGGFVAHLSIPTGVQTSKLNTPLPQQTDLSHSLVTPSESTIAECARLLAAAPFAIWVGFGARGAAAEILQLAERTGAAVMCSPRSKGIFPENHPQYVGVTGLGGHQTVMKYMQECPPERTLVLGTRLGEPTSFWSSTMVPRCGFIHVDIDPEVPGVAYPFAETFPIQSDIGVFLRALLKQLPSPSKSKVTLPHPKAESVEPRMSSLVRPEALMMAIQRTIVAGSNAVIMAESGNSFTWATHMLRIDSADRYRVSTGVGSMGHMVTGVVGAARVRPGKAVAIVGDGAMLMNSEVSTAVKYQIPAIWIVLNDARYNMCDQGMAMLGLKGADAVIPQTDFVMLARGMGADGIRVNSEAELQTALEQAIASPGPFIVDVIIDRTRLAPAGARNKSLQAQGAKSAPAKQQISFPMV